MKRSKRLKNHASLVKFAGVSYALLAIFYPVFLLSSAESSHGSETLGSFLKQIISGGAVEHVWWMFFTLIPMLIIFGAIGFYSTVKPYAPKLSVLTLVFSVCAAFAFLLGIGRWSTLNWGLGEAFLMYKENSEYLSAVYYVSNEVLGYWIGHIFAEISLFASIGAMSIAMFYSKRFPIWLSGFAAIVFILGFSAVFRGFDPLSSYLHSFLSAFMLVPIFFVLLAIALLRFVRRSKEKPISRKKHKRKL